MGEGEYESWWTKYVAHITRKLNDVLKEGTYRTEDSINHAPPSFPLQTIKFREKILRDMLYTWDNTTKGSLAISHIINPQKFQNGMAPTPIPVHVPQVSFYQFTNAIQVGRVVFFLLSQIHLSP